MTSIILGAVSMMKFIIPTILLRSTMSYHATPRLQRLSITRTSLPSTLIETDDNQLSSTSKIAVERGHVYFVATPIGNMKDITDRAKEVLTKVDVICAEDTRHTIQLLRMLSLPHKQLMSHHEHNWHISIPKIISLVKQGNSVAVVSDAGTPGISDPGAELAHALGKENIPVHPVPGASAVVSALSISGFSGSDFSFMGFLSVKEKDRRLQLQRMYNNPYSVVFFEAPHRVQKTFRDLVQVDSNSADVDVHSIAYRMADRPCVCCRELTKLHEEVRRGTVQEVLQWLDQTSDDTGSSESSKKKVSAEIPTYWRWLRMSW